MAHRLEAFCGTNVDVLDLPQSVQLLGDKCFFGCEGLIRVAFDPASSLNSIGVESFSRTCLTEISIPKDVEELCDRCFFDCALLSKVTFHSSAALKHIGVEAFARTGIVHVILPGKLQELSRRCFYHCTNLVSVTFTTLIVDVSRPSVGFDLSSCGDDRTCCQIGAECFDECESLVHFTYAEASRSKKK